MAKTFTSPTSGIKSNRRLINECCSINATTGWLIEYYQDVNKYNEDAELLVKCQALYVGTKSQARCIANDINHCGEISITEQSLKHGANKGKLICKTLI